MQANFKREMKKKSIIKFIHFDKIWRKSDDKGTHKETDDITEKMIGQDSDELQTVQDTAQWADSIQFLSHSLPTTPTSSDTNTT